MVFVSKDNLGGDFRIISSLETSQSEGFIILFISSSTSKY